jgi:Outer membrane protein beta-barrel domain
MLYLRSRQIKVGILATLVSLTSSISFAQMRELNLPDHQDKRIYFGITFAYNKSSFKSSMHPNFLVSDSIFSAEPYGTSGFSMGFSATARLTNRFELRYNPQLLFAEKNINYHLKYPIGTKDETEFMNKKVESIIFSSPIHIKLNSDRINNFSFYVFGGAKIDFDLASNARKKKAEELVKINGTDIGIEAGVGFQFYMKSFIFTPEIKVSNGLNNIHFRDETLKFSNVIDQLRSKMIVFSIHLQG